MAAPDARLEQMFPSLSPEEIDRLRRFGTARRYAAGELLFRAGDINSAMFVLISGSVGLSARDGLGHVLDIIELGPGGFLAEAGMLAGQPRLADARANSDTEVLLESSIPGVFAVGDVRSGSAKRVGGAIGEGAAVVGQLHTVLADAPSPMLTFREGAR